MEITNNQVSQYSYDKNTTRQTNSSNTTNSFDSYLTATSEVQNTTNTQEKQKVDYSNYTMSDLLNTPYEEAKANYEQINTRKKELIDNGLSESEKKDSAKLFVQMATINYSGNDSFDKGFYETLQNSDSENSLVMFYEIQTNLSDYYYGKDVNASFVVSNDEIHSNKDLTKSQINSINFNDFISTMLKDFNEDLNNASTAQDSVKEQYQLLIDSYSSLQNSYSKSMKEKYYV